MARFVVTGGAGFLGSHLCDLLIQRGDEVVAIDNLSTSDGRNLSVLLGSRRFSFIEADVCGGLGVEGGVDAVAHLASPASPADYGELPIETLRVGSCGTENALLLAEANDARFVLASTSEVYGDPDEHPQQESYFGNVDPVGPRSMYDEAKRYAEALTVAFARFRGVDAGIIRIFNTYGPRLRAGDGRVVSNFITQALAGEALTIYGTGSQTRSFCYVEDLVRGIASMLSARGVLGPVNLGNPEEKTISDVAQEVLAIVGSSAGTVHRPSVPGDPTRRCPDITLARERLSWTPTVPFREGVARTVNWFEEQIGSDRC